MATSNQLENSRVSEGTLRTETTEAEISNMIAEGGPASPREGTVRAADELKTGRLVTGSTLIGRRVLKPDGEELGNIEEIMLDLKSGRIVFAVLSFRCFPGTGNKRFPVPWNALRIEPGDQNLVLDVDRNTLEGAPEFDQDSWPEMADPVFGRIVHKYYGTNPDWDYTVTGADTRMAPGREYKPTSGHRVGTRH